MRTQRSILIFASATTTTLITMLVGLIATPYLIDWLGEETYGAYRVTLDWLGNLLILELGIAGAVGPLLAGALGREDDDELEALLAGGVRALGFVTVAIVALGIVLTVVIPHLVPVDPSLVDDLRIACAVGVLGFLLLPLSAFRLLVDARQRTYWVNALLLFQGLLTTGLALTAAYAGLGIRGQLLALTVGSLPIPLVTTVVGLRRYPGVLWRALSRRTTPETHARIVSLSWPTFALSLCGRACFLVDQIVIGLLLGPAKVVPFFVTQRLGVLAQGHLESIGGATWAALAELHARGEHTVFNARIVELSRLTSILGIAVLVPVVAYNGAFVSLWVGAPRYGGDAVTIVVGILAVLQGLQSLWTWVFTATERVRRVVRIWLLAAVLNLGASIALTHELGLIGPLLGSLIAFLATTFWYLPWLLRREFETPLRELAPAVLVPFAVGALVGLAAWKVAHAYPPQGWISLGAQAGGLALLLLVLGSRLLIPARERALWRQRLHTRLPFIRPPSSE